MSHIHLPVTPEGWLYKSLPHLGGFFPEGVLLSLAYTLLAIPEGRCVSLKHTLLATPEGESTSPVHSLVATPEGGCIGFSYTLLILRRGFDKSCIHSGSFSGGGLYKSHIHPC